MQHENNYVSKYIKYKHKYIEYKTMYPSLVINGGGKSKEIYFIRHGETQFNLENKAQGGDIDISLNETGKTQSIQTGKYLQKYRIKNKAFDCILCSPMKRAKETAELIADEINFNKNNIMCDSCLVEPKLGIITENSELSSSLKKKFHEKLESFDDPIKENIFKTNYKKFKEFWDKIYPDNGIESYDDLVRRTNKFKDTLINSKYKKIIVVSHSSLLTFLFSNIFHIPAGECISGKNCYVCYCKLNNDIFTMVTTPNTNHLT